MLDTAGNRGLTCLNKKIDLSFLKGLSIYSNSLKERLHNKWKLGKQKIAGPFIIMDRKDLSFRPTRGMFCKKERLLIKPKQREIYGHRKKVGSKVLWPYHKSGMGIYGC